MGRRPGEWLSTVTSWGMMRKRVRESVSKHWRLGILSRRLRPVEHTIHAPWADWGPSGGALADLNPDSSPS